jgi:membrane-anchored protein YejM (alkaline phosphatase superfamily)
VETTHSRKNVIIILIDALRYDRLVQGGYKYNLTPNLNKIIKNSTFFENHFANGCPTSISFPSIFTSTYPLDFNGYNSGIKDRPKTFAEVFVANGYDTFGVTSAHPSGDHFHYNRGFRLYENLLDFYQWFRQNLKVYLREDLIKYKENEISKSEILKKLSINYLSVLNSTIKYITQFENLGLDGKNFNIRKNKNKIIYEIKLLKENPEAILQKFLDFDYLYYLFLGEEHVNFIKKKYILIKENIRVKINKVINLFPRRKIYQAGEIFERFKIYKKKNNNKKFLAFIHLFDVHESKNFVFKFSFSFLISFFKLIILRKFKFGGFIYDLSVILVDKEIGHFFKYLKKEEVLDNSYIAISSDHGMVAGFPKRSKTNLSLKTDLSQNFYDEFIKVPLILYPKVENVNTNKLTSHIDFAPTILNLCNIENIREFKGSSILNPNYQNDYVLSENTGSGLCDVKNKNIYICLRNKEIKITYEIIDFDAKERDVFDLHSDPLELSNIVNIDIKTAERKYFMIEVKKRISQILKYVQ